MHEFTMSEASDAGKKVSALTPKCRRHEILAGDFDDKGCGAFFI